ncbi:hypothetical protein [Dyella terrae]|uniref:hypothetical protein n=1 Tax=Dyella terrae TaxID=522259 RepID=UPI001EFDB531|nr:hypothetical protein [Dyella terrae]ULU27552.1 hypothetical protein DYST_04513 [Dyella terrae]
MKIVRTTAFVAASLLAATAWAQNSETPLNLKLPANLPASSASAAASNTAAPTDASKAVSGNANATAQANAQTGAYTKDPPGTYYGDTSGALGDTQAAAGPAPGTVPCDDATYNQPQVHGAVTTGVVAGNHMSGSYGGAGVTVSQAFGSCEHPSGGMSISVSGSQGHFGR